MRKKVLVCASTAEHLERFHLPYLAYFRQEGWEVHTASKGIPLSSDIEKAWDIPFQKELLSLGNLKQLFRLLGIFKREQYDLLLIHTSLAAAWCRLAFFRLLCPRTRLVYVCHGYFMEATSEGILKKNPRSLFYLTCERLLAGRTDLLMLMNRTDWEIARRYKLCRRPVFINGMGLDARRYHAAGPETAARLRKSWRAAEHTLVFLCVGEFSPRKNQLELLRAFSRLAGQAEDVRLILAGSGALEPVCRAFVQENRLEKRVHFAGQISDISPYFCAADALVSSSRSEGLPFNIMEALYFHLPVIASRVKGHTDLIRHRENGLIYDPGNPEALSAALQSFIRQPELRASLQERAKLDPKYLYPNAGALIFQALSREETERMKEHV
ncbi:MAG: glycosyltransferase family 4 protein [Provencibacterium sp.]|jgi:glycosyltransferase involved in cell wall biosynthesis|nr:glycosyltransferase family 4 protein [Provencibacterium sp.]